MSERVNARLKDEFGASQIRVRGAAMVMAHLMFGVLALTVDQWLRLSASGQRRGFQIAPCRFRRTSPTGRVAACLRGLFCPVCSHPPQSQRTENRHQFARPIHRTVCQDHFRRVLQVGDNTNHDFSLAVSNI